ncbi:MAG: hypothetical protein HC803_09970, partial [Saprospiraceae bacterium]|nr:hypothetical protein [Saprospiraceae bacterium]
YTDQNPSVVYTTPGLYDVELIITSLSGCFDTIRLDDFIRVDGPYGELNVTPKQGCIDLSVDFNAPLSNTEALII